MKKKTKKSRQESGFITRLEKEMARWAVSQAGLAARLRLSPGTVSGWFTKGYQPQPRIMQALAEMLGVSEAWLAHGMEPRLGGESLRVGEQVARTLPAGKSRDNAVAYGTPSSVKMIPLISWAQAGIATAFEEIPEHWQERIPAAVQDRHAFAIQLRGDSMEPKYSDGDVAIVLPHTAARHGDLVVANIKEDGFAFKVLNLVGGDPRHVRLTSFNPVYQPMDFDREDFHWIYPVDSVTKRVRRV
jgi:phage repressor protein C with HTH and peptisase S24 domain